MLPETSANTKCPICREKLSKRSLQHDTLLPAIIAAFQPLSATQTEATTKRKDVLSPSTRQGKRYRLVETRQEDNEAFQNDRARQDDAPEGLDLDAEELLGTPSPPLEIDASPLPGPPPSRLRSSQLSSPPGEKSLSRRKSAMDQEQPLIISETQYPSPSPPPSPGGHSGSPPAREKEKVHRPEFTLLSPSHISAISDAIDAHVEAGQSVHEEACQANVRALGGMVLMCTRLTVEQAELVERVARTLGGLTVDVWTRHTSVLIDSLGKLFF